LAKKKTRWQKKAKINPNSKHTGAQRSKRDHIPTAYISTAQGRRRERGEKKNCSGSKRKIDVDFSVPHSQGVQGKREVSGQGGGLLGARKIPS